MNPDPAPQSALPSTSVPAEDALGSTDPTTLQLEQPPNPAAESNLSPQAAAQPPTVGMRIGEFLLLEELGRGAFGQVFLAGQEGLNRRVALKISRLRVMSEEEGKALGGLEHDHIVKVYSAFTHAETGWHCLCLQYVPGLDLRSVIERLHRTDHAPTSGRYLLTVLDLAGRRDESFDPAALRGRAALAADDFPQAVCRIGGELAEALAFAHAKGVLHCDIKPANILLNAYGRPLLADFNVAFNRARKSSNSGLGGTRPYMAPEHLAAILESKPEWVNERCDLYSLGVVLHELAAGVRPPMASYPPTGNEGQRDRLPEATRDGGPLDRVPRELAAVIRRCLEPAPVRRYPSAAELAAALAGAWGLLAARRRMPRSGTVGRWVTAHPIRALVLAGVLPHAAASVVNITYNGVQIALSPDQQRAFAVLVLAYNLVVYPVCVGAAVVLFRRVAHRLHDLPHAGGPAVDDLRQRVRHLGGQVAGLGATGWFPGAIVFPLVIDLAAGPVGWRVYAHFAVSFALSGLIGVVFSYLLVQYVVFRALLPKIGNPDTFTPAGMRAEVRPLAAPFGSLVLLACAVPLTGAVLLVATADGTLTLGFRLLTAALIGLGVGAVGLAERVVSRLNRLASVWGKDEADDEPKESMMWGGLPSQYTGAGSSSR